MHGRMLRASTHVQLVSWSRLRYMPVHAHAQRAMHVPSQAEITGVVTNAKALRPNIMLTPSLCANKTMMVEC